METSPRPSRSATRKFTDPDLMAAMLATGVGKWKVLGRGAFCAEMTAVGLDRVSVQSTHERLARVAHHAMKPGMVGILCWPRAGLLPVVRGVQMRPGDLMSVGLDMESYHQTSGSVDYASLVLDADELARVSIELCGRELELESGHVLRPPYDGVSHLLSLMDDACRVARDTPQVFEVDEASRALEQELLRALTRCMQTDEASRESEPYARRAKIMARFEAVVEANAGRPLHLRDLCRLVGVPERTLRKCCQQHLGMGPHQFLLRQRIHLTRRALLRGDPSSASVTSIATSHGFWELGRFAVMYRAMFGEPPSATLRRSQAEFA